MSRFFVLILLGLPAIAQEEGQKPGVPDRDAEFAKLMTGCRLLGAYTAETPATKAPKKEAYTITKAVKLDGDRWRLHAKIEYGSKSLVVPVVVHVAWAGDTPVIQVTDLGIPLLGTYTARVLIYRNSYAGMWQGSDHGGHLFGRVERLEETQKPEEGGDKKGG